MARIGRLGVLLFSLSLPHGAFATTWYVDSMASPGGDGSSWEHAFATIQAARDAADDDDVIIVAPGSYSDPSGTISFGKAVTLQSSDPDDPDVVSTTILEETGIRAANSQTSFSVRGFTIRGAGVSLVCRSVTITKNVIVGLPWRDSVGISVHTADGLIDRNVIANHNGRGISCRNSSVAIVNNVIAANSAGYGGAILCEDSEALIMNNTIVRNSASVAGGGIFCDGESTPTIANCVLWENGDDLYNCQATYSCIEDGDPGEGNFCYYPYFMDPDNGDCHLEPWSPCIDAGDPASPFFLEPEPNGGRVNVGAYGNSAEAACRCADAGGDGLPDEWEMLQFGHLDYGGQDDADGDRISNVTEYLFGWDPTCPAITLVDNISRGKCYQEIQPAIFEAGDGEEIVVFPGNYQESINFMGKAITVRSADPLDLAIVASTVIEADTGDVVSFSTAESRRSVVRGFELRHPRGIAGRAILCEASSPTISRNRLVHNTLGAWSGPFKSEKGAGIYIRCGSPLIEYNTIQDNDGSAIHCEEGEPVIRWNILTENFGASGALHLERCPSALIEGNEITANGAGGLYIGYSHACILNNLISLNRSAGAHLLGGTGLIRGCTIARNSSAGISTSHAIVGFVVSNCILWQNGVELENVNATYSCVQGSAPGEGNISDDPLFISPTGGDFRLRANSPCINAGNTAAALEVALSPVDHGALISWSAGEDLDANPRISGSALDMGAYEYQEGPPDLHFLVEYSSDLESWESIQVGSAWEWIDETLDGVGKRFYRLRVR
ncbi:right-handed parallel beta-helix repeat-containing protein [bacterium]|nr:right-handed parallel beta-helix repeat-containing protein [bacterium]